MYLCMYVCQNHFFRQAKICGSSTRQKTFIAPSSVKGSKTYLSLELNLKNASSVNQTLLTHSEAQQTPSVKLHCPCQPSQRPQRHLEKELKEDSTKSKAQPLPGTVLDSPSSTKSRWGLLLAIMRGRGIRNQLGSCQ